MRKKKEINTENYLDKIPAICGDLDWMENNGLVTVVQENKGFYNRLAQKMFKTPEVSLCRSEERRVGKECRSRWSPYH